MKKLLLLVLLIGCSPTNLIHGVYDITDINIKQVDGEYHVYYYVHVGKDVDYYITYYYVGGELLYSERTQVKKSLAKTTIGILQGFVLSDPAEVRIVVRAFIGNKYSITKTKEFIINVPSQS